MAAAAAASKSNVRKTMAAEEEVCSHLPEELWECIFKSLNGHCRTFKSLSIVCKQFLSITNRLKFSFEITGKTIPHLPRLFHRFPNLTSLDVMADDIGPLLTSPKTNLSGNIISVQFIEFLFDNCKLLKEIKDRRRGVAIYPIDAI